MVMKKNEPQLSHSKTIIKNHENVAPVVHHELYTFNTILNNKTIIFII